MAAGKAECCGRRPPPPWAGRESVWALATANMVGDREAGSEDGQQAKRAGRGRHRCTWGGERLCKGAMWRRDRLRDRGASGRQGRRSQSSLSECVPASGQPVATLSCLAVPAGLSPWNVRLPVAQPMVPDLCGGG